MDILGTITVTDNILGQIIISINDLGPGQSVTTTSNYTIQQSDINAGYVINSAYAIANNIISNTVTTTVIATQSPALTITKTPNTLTYTDG